MTKRKKYPKKEAGVIQLTPKLAEELLAIAITEKQRHIKPQKVKEYADAMVRGIWSWSGEAIILDWFGIMRNGLHRSQAVIESGITITTTISL